MAWIKIIDETEADGALQAAYEEVSAARGRIANILKVHSLNPAAMTAHLALYRRLMFGPSELSRAEREMIAVAVSVANNCHYWIHHHGEALRALTKNDGLVACLERDPATAPLDVRERAVVDYALKLTREPREIGEGDVAQLRAAGLSDSAIHDAAAITAYFNLVNRVALGLGVELEEG